MSNNPYQPPETETQEPIVAGPATLHPYTRENLLGFKGRMNRLDFAILFFTVCALEYLFMKLSGVNPIASSLQHSLDPESFKPNSTFITIGLIGKLICVYLTIKRFHDINYSGLIALVFIIPFLGLPIISPMLVFIGAILYLILFFAPGVPHVNKYGQPPAANHRNKVLILILAIFAFFLVVRSFIPEAMPLYEEFQELIQEQLQQT